jgi:hypothetical protein
VFAQPTAREFEDWADRFSEDLRLAELKSADEGVFFVQSQWSAGTSINYLNQMHSATQLFPKSRNRRVWTLGEALRVLTRGSSFAGPGGEVVGAKLNSYLPAEGLEVLYLHPVAEPRDRLEAAIKQRFGVRKLKVPPAGTFRRNEYPFLLFKRIDGKLYLAAFSKEFMAVVDAIFTLQIAGADHGELEVAVAAYAPSR